MTLQRIFEPDSVAIIGASKDERKRGYQAIKSLLDEKFEGAIYPVNPRERSILGIKCYPSVLDIPGQVDVALITTPADTVEKLMNECGQKGIAGAVVISGGFAELGDEGKKRERAIVAAARKHGLRIIGPNTSGMISTNRHLNLVGLRNVPAGDIALLTQSGNIALNLITEAGLKSRKGFSAYVGVGNEADIRFHEYLEYFRKDPRTKVILIYVEGLRDGRKFLQQAYRTTIEKPIVLLKGGRSKAGSSSAGSHTGALAGISAVANTAFTRAGIITIENSDELFPAAETLSCLPPIKNNKVAILADGGGHATIAADVLSDGGIELAHLKKSTRQNLAAILPRNAAIGNPVDVAGGTDSDPTLFADCARILLEDEAVGGLLIVGLFGGYAIRFAEGLSFLEEDAAHRMGKLIGRYDKPIVLHSLYNFARPHSLELMRYYNIPVYDSVEIACKAIEVLSRYGHFRGTHHRRTNFILDPDVKGKPKAHTILANAIAEGRATLMENEAKSLLHVYGAPILGERIATTADEAVSIARDIPGPVAMKILSPDILHKSDAGGVRLNLTSDERVHRAFIDIIDNARHYDPHARIIGCLVAPMAEQGVEVIIGTKYDDQFGPVIMFGLGGVMVEVIKDVSFRVLPLSRMAARAMLNEIKGAPLLNGIRNTPPIDKKALIDLLLTVSNIIEGCPEIKEMDLNPVVVSQSGATILDARIILHPKGKDPNRKKQTEGLEDERQNGDPTHHLGHS